jgi:hypothetical protein
MHRHTVTTRHSRGRPATRRSPRTTADGAGTDGGAQSQTCWQIRSQIGCHTRHFGARCPSDSWAGGRYGNSQQLTHIRTGCGSDCSREALQARPCMILKQPTSGGRQGHVCLPVWHCSSGGSWGLQVTYLTVKHDTSTSAPASICSTTSRTSVSGRLALSRCSTCSPTRPVTLPGTRFRSMEASARVRRAKFPTLVALDDLTESRTTKRSPTGTRVRQDG